MWHNRCSLACAPVDAHHIDTLTPIFAPWHTTNPVRMPRNGLFHTFMYEVRNDSWNCAQKALHKGPGDSSRRGAGRTLADLLAVHGDEREDEELEAALGGALRRQHVPRPQPPRHQAAQHVELAAVRAACAMTPCMLRACM